MAVRRHAAAHVRGRTHDRHQHRRRRAVADRDAGGRSGPAQHRDQRQRSAVDRGPLCRSRGVDAAERPLTDTGHDVRDGSRGRGGRARAAWPRDADPAPASSTWRPRIRASGALNDCVSRCRWPQRIHRHGTPVDARGPGHADHCDVYARTDETTKQQFGVADVTLAPLAEGEYVLELSLTKGGQNRGHHLRF